MSQIRYVLVRRCARSDACGLVLQTQTPLKPAMGWWCRSAMPCLEGTREVGSCWRITFRSCRRLGPAAEPHQSENTPWEVALCGVHLLHGPRLGVRGGCGAVRAVSHGVCKAPQAVLQGDLSRSSRARMCVSASQRNLCSCFLFVCLFSPSHARSQGASPPAVL